MKYLHTCNPSDELKMSPGMSTVKWTIRDYINNEGEAVAVHLTNDVGFKLGFDCFESALAAMKHSANADDTFDIQVVGTFE